MTCRRRSTYENSWATLKEGEGHARSSEGCLQLLALAPSDSQPLGTCFPHTAAESLMGTLEEVRGNERLGCWEARRIHTRPPGRWLADPEVIGPSTHRQMFNLAAIPPIGTPAKDPRRQSFGPCCFWAPTCIAAAVWHLGASRASRWPLRCPRGKSPLHRGMKTNDFAERQLGVQALDIRKLS
jgi:hypothetical protein